MDTFGSCSDRVDHSSGSYEKEQEELNQNTIMTTGLAQHHKLKRICLEIGRFFYLW